MSLQNNVLAIYELQPKKWHNHFKCATFTFYHTVFTREIVFC